MLQTIIIVLWALVFIALTASLAYDLGKQQGQVNCAPNVERAYRYQRAVDDLDRWCGHTSPHAELIARHLKARGERAACNAGTPHADEACTVSGVREQLRRLDAAHQATKEPQR